MLLALLELQQQALDELHLRHEEGRAGQGPQVHDAAAVLHGPEQILHVDDAHHAVQVALHQREAGVDGGAGEGEVLRQAVGQVEAHHPGPGHGDLLHGAAAEIEQVLDEFLAVQLQAPLGLAALEHAAELGFRRQHVLGVGLGVDAEDAQDHVAQPDEDPGKGAHEAGPGQQRPGGAQGPGHGGADGQAAGHQLGQHHIQGGHHQQGQARAQGRHQGRPGQVAEGGAEAVAEQLLAHGTQGQGAQHDARLDGGEVVAQVPMHLQGEGRPGIGVHQGLQLRGPHAHGRELGHDEEGAGQEEGGADEGRGEVHGGQPFARSEPRRSRSWTSWSRASRLWRRSRCSES